MESKSENFAVKISKPRKNQGAVVYSDLLNQTLLIDAYQQVLNLQISLINELTLNKRLITQFITRRQASNIKNKSKSTDVGTDKISPQFILKSGSGSQNPFSPKNQNKVDYQSSPISKPRKIKRISKKVSSGSCYNPSSQNSQKNRIKMVRETKHIPKNYGKAIINFMMKNPKIVEQLCEKFGKNVQQLWKVVQSFRGKIYTVANLRSMWIQEENPFSKIFRIISMLYLRKHCLEHIFNSRVQNFTRHIKYRYKIIQAVGNPESFNRIKQY